MSLKHILFIALALIPFLGISQDENSDRSLFIKGTPGIYLKVDQKYTIAQSATGKTPEEPSVYMLMSGDTESNFVISVGEIPLEDTREADKKTPGVFYKKGRVGGEIISWRNSKVEGFFCSETSLYLPARRDTKGRKHKVIVVIMAKDEKQQKVMEEMFNSLLLTFDSVPPETPLINIQSKASSARRSN